MAPVSVSFLAHEFALCPENEAEPDRIEMQLLVGESTDDALSVLNCFMSALAWTEGKRLRIAQWMLFGGPGGTMGKGAAKFNSNGLATRAKTIIIDYLPAPVGDDQQLGLALYREALNNNSIAYSFLSFVKIVNIRFDKGRSQKAWINATIPKLT